MTTNSTPTPGAVPATFLERVGAAPISWGICEAPGWGVQMPVDRVLGEMSGLGITAIEQGALGWLPVDPTEQLAKLREYGMTLIGGFVPLVLHDPAGRAETMARADAVAAAMAACGGTNFVTAVVGSLDDWFRPELDAAGWATLFQHLAEVDEIVAGHGLTQVVHPHVDTLIETDGEFRRFLDDTEVKVCFDTGHLTIGDADVVGLARDHADRIGLVHLKDVDADVAARERSGELGLMEATQAGLFPSLGDGVVPLAAIIEALGEADYGGWFVMETDVALTEGEPPAGVGPVLGVARSLEFLTSLAANATVAS